ncbi:hypothetical protein [Hoyosella altamirensis]|uniref:ABC transporter permease n=1 Tax=Hoyosella altamirensis TaxID=616997 RepID=A0A839RHB4_9ACTN|nr:hypothetical protein [Hoyosella altamirensis]MBB3035777.1 hypothetical protein [Hoyosella altamirensis]
MDATSTASPWSKAIGIACALSLLVGLLLAAFAWPAARSAPADLPIAVAGPPAAVAEFSAQLDDRAPGVFAITEANDASAAEALVTDREVYGAFVLSPGSPPALLTASAASPVVAHLLTGVASGPAMSDVNDLAPFTGDDPRGAGFAAAALPMVMGGLLIGVASSLALAGATRRLVAVLLGAALSGLVAGLVAQGWLGVLAGSYWINSAAIALTIGAIGITLVGLHSVLGHAGIALGAITVFLIGNPLSGVAVAPEMLPGSWGTVGQFLPPGAGADLLRSVSFFDGVGLAQPTLVLAFWGVAGLLLILVGVLRGRHD